MDSKAKAFFQKLAPYLAGAGDVLVNADQNEAGPDDFAGHILLYGADVVTSVLDSADLPPLPDELSKPITGKISGVALITLQVASAALTVAQFQLTGKAAQAFRYINQVLRALVAGKPAPEPPAALA